MFSSFSAPCFAGRARPEGRDSGALEWLSGARLPPPGTPAPTRRWHPLGLAGWEQRPLWLARLPDVHLFMRWVVLGCADTGWGWNGREQVM